MMMQILNRRLSGAAALRRGGEQPFSPPTGEERLDWLWLREALAEPASGAKDRRAAAAAAQVN